MSGLLEALLIRSLGILLAVSTRTEPVPSTNPLELEASSPAWENEELLDRLRERPHN